MAIYVVTGKLGAGKTLCAVGRIRDYLLEGRRVATNLDLHLENILPATDKRARCVRIPDKPTVADLEALGEGSDSIEEESFGALVLDELGSWLNAREWADKGRQGVIDWLIHSRKRRWDVFFIVQHVSLLDKQVREAMMEYLVVCKRMDRVRIPFFGGLVKALSFGAVKGTFPKVHLAVVSYTGGTANVGNALVSDRWIYRGRDLYHGYDTEQVFTSSYSSGTYSYLTPWHVKGRYLPGPRWQVLQAAVGRWCAGGHWDVLPRPVAKPKAALVGKLMALAPDDRVRHWRRLEALGAF